MSDVVQILNDNGMAYKDPYGNLYTAGQYAGKRLPIINGIVLRKRAPDWVEITCTHDLEWRGRLDFHLNDYQKEMLFEKGQEAVHVFRCPKCQEVGMLTLIPSTEVCEAGFRLGTALPEGIYNSGPNSF